jgi:N-acetylmuramoyl-L-alanine amidase
MLNLIIAHSQQDHNACAVGDTESAHMWKMAQTLGGIMKQDSFFNVFVVPDVNKGSDSNNLKEAIRLIKQFEIANPGKSILLDLHSDAGSKISFGCSALYKSSGGKLLAETLYKEMSDLTPWPDGGVRYRDDLGIINQTRSIAVVIETAFHDKSVSANWLHENLVSIPVRLANGLFKYITIPGTV